MQVSIGLGLTFIYKHKEGMRAKTQTLGHCEGGPTQKYHTEELKFKQESN